jgi:two-component system response regulator HydG
MSRILVIDDDSGHRLILKSRLAETGYEVVQADSGAKALVEARAQPFDAFVVAARMGKGVDGYETCRRLKAIPERAHVPVILFNDQTATAEEPTRAFEAGCDAFVTRPDLPSLDHVLRVHVRNKKRIEELARENQALHQQNKKLGAVDEGSRPASADHAPRETGDHAAVLRELAAGKPDGLMVVDGEGTVRFADRGANEIFGSRLEGMHLGHLAPASGLEAFVRDARIETREGFRFELPARKNRMARLLNAVVVPLLSQAESERGALRVVLIQDGQKRRLACDLLKLPATSALRAELGPLIEAAREVYRPQSLIGSSAAVQGLREAVVAALRTDEPVLLRGDRNSGTEHVARVLHYAGSSTGTFLHLRCAGQTADNLELELFGYAKGALQGSPGERPGLFHLAQDGTLYLEDVIDLAPALQEKVHQFLSAGTVQRKGALKPDRVDVRIVASAGSAIDHAVEQGRFSRALYERLAERQIPVPPLAQRIEDVEPLARHSLARFGAPRRVLDFADDTLELLRRYEWPGSLAELEESIDQACALATDGILRIENLPRPLRDARARLIGDEIVPTRRVASTDTVGGTHAVHDMPVHELRPQPTILGNRTLREWDITDADPVSLDVYEKKAILRAIDTSGGDKLAAARLLQIGKSTLYRKLKYHNIR